MSMDMSASIGNGLSSVSSKVEPCLFETTPSDSGNYPLMPAIFQVQDSDAVAGPTGGYIADVTTPEKNVDNATVKEADDFTQAHTTDTPEIEGLYNAYVDSCNDASATSTTRMTCAKALAFALLQYCYPTSQGYSVKPSSLGPISKRGMSFVLKAEDGSDIWRDLPVQKPIKPTKKRGGPTKKQREEIEKANKMAAYNHGLRYTVGLKWASIKPEDIAGFVVARNIFVTEEFGIAKLQYRPHTCLAIIMDSFDSLPHFSTENAIHRSDVLTDVLCKQARLREGYGILFYGPRIEFYKYSAGADWIFYESDSDNTGKTGKARKAGKSQKKAISDDEAQNIEPILSPFMYAEGGGELAFDVRTSTLQSLIAAFHTAAAHGVTYISDIVVTADNHPSRRPAHDLHQ